MNRKKIGHGCIKLIVPLAVVIVWTLLSRSGQFSELVLPPPHVIWSSFVESVTSGMMASDLVVSLSIVIRGFLIGGTLGLIFGLLMGIFLPVNELLSTTINALRQIPPLAWIPLLILWVGIGDVSKIILISLGVFYPVLLNTISGISEVSTSYLEFAQNYAIKKKDVLLHILLPGAFPSIFVGLRLGAGQSWVSIVAAEMIAATAGVGYRINSARNLMQPGQVIVYMILIGVIGGLMDALLRRLEKRAIKWRSQ